MKNYSSYFCRKCKKTTILLNDEIKDTIKNNKYIACSHCGSRNIHKENESDGVKDCMRSSSYKRVRGAIRQVHNE